MIVRHEDVVVEGGEYRVCESIFIDFNFRTMPHRAGEILGTVCVVNALGEVYDRTCVNLFPLPVLALATVECLRLNHEIAPALIEHDEECRRVSWTSRSLTDRALIRLHAAYDSIKSPRKKISYISFLLRLLISASGIRFIFVMKDNQVTHIKIVFGDPGKSEREVIAPFSEMNRIREVAFVAVSEKLET
jgi:hypothetical protein